MDPFPKYCCNHKYEISQSDTSQNQFTLLYNPVVLILYLSYMQNCVDNKSTDCTVVDLTSTHRKNDSDYATASGCETNKGNSQVHNILP